MPSKQYGYYITFDGILFLDTLPDEFKDSPYHYLQTIERKKKQRETIEDWPKRNWILADTIKSLTSAIIGGLIGTLITIQCNHSKAQSKVKEFNSINVYEKTSAIA